MKCLYDRFSLMLFFAHEPQPIESVKLRPLSNEPPLLKQCGWFTSTRATSTLRANSSACSGSPV